MIIKTLILLGLISIAFCDHWSVLVAGSNIWYNYRHQSDVCHAYQILHKHGVPDQNIVVMMYNDIAFNKANPYPNNIINRPYGPNVYSGVPHDYTRNHVNVSNFLSVLKGNSTATKGRKVLRSGPNDDVFIYFADHGGPSVFAFPNDLLYADQLMEALYDMYIHNRYRQMVIYMEACESGSMFAQQTLNNLTLADMRIYATTAATPDEPSFACYYDSVRQVYLGDVYSVNWLRNSDVANMTIETVLDQFKLVRNETNTSTVCEYGNTSISHDLLQEFQGSQVTKFNKKSPRTSKLLDYINPQDVIRSDRADVSTYLRILEKELNQSLIDIDFDHVSEIYQKLDISLKDMLTARKSIPEDSSKKILSICNQQGVDSKKVRQHLKKISEFRRPNAYDLEALKYQDIYID